MSYRNSTIEAEWRDGMPRHRWFGFLRATSSIGVLAGVATSASAALPYATIPFDPRIPVVTGSGAPIVFGAGVAMIVASIASLWWANARVRKPLDQLHLAVDNAVADGFHKRLDLPGHGIGPILTNVADRLQDITVSITDVGFEDGERRLRMVFRDDAAAKFQGILSSLSSLHDGIVAREAERDEQQRAVLERTARAALTLEEVALQHNTEQLKLSAAVQNSRDALSAIQDHLTRLQQIDPSSVNAVIERLGEQTRSIVSIIETNSSVRGEVGEASQSLQETSNELRNSFRRLKRELEETADNARGVTQKREAMLVAAVSSMEAKLRGIEESLEGASEDVSLTGEKLRAASDALKNDQARNQEVFAHALGTFSSNCDGLLESVQADLKHSITNAHVEVAKSVRDNSYAINETLENVDRSVSRRLQDIEEATSQFDRAITTAFRDNQTAIEASLSWLDRSVTDIIGHNQSAVEDSVSRLDSSISKSLQYNSEAIDGAVVTITDEVRRDLSTQRAESTAAIEKLINQMRDQVADGQSSLAEAVFNTECLSDALGAAEARLEASVAAASNVFEQSALEARTSLSELARKTADSLEASVAGASEKMTAAADGIGTVAASALREELVSVRTAADEHAEFLREATLQMRAEADRLGEAQQASEIVRSMARTAEEQLREVSKSFEDKSEAAIQSVERAAHDVEYRSKDTAQRIDKVHHQAEKSNELLLSSIEPLAGLLGRTRTMLENISEIEESQLGPSLRRIQSSLRGISNYIEESGDEQLSRMTTAVREEMRRTASGITNPIEELLPAVSEQRDKIAEMEAGLRKLAESGSGVSVDLAREVADLCADQIAAANMRLHEIENGIETRLDVLGTAIEQVRVQTPQQIEQAVDTLTARFEERASARQAGLEAAFTMLQSSVEKQLSLLSDARDSVEAKEVVVDKASIETAAANAVESGISKLAEDLKTRLEAISARVSDASSKNVTSENASAAGAAPTEPVKPVVNAPLDQQITAIQGLVEAVEQQAIELAHVATASPELLSEMPEARDALASAENALAAWTRQLDNVSTAVAIAKDASHQEKRAA
ncbi:MAG: hypothetical protein AAF941_02995 [Pseudomonadota bacterium]